MPRYDYQCLACGKTEERFERIGDSIVECGCGNGFMKRLFSPPSAIIADIEPYFDHNIGDRGGEYVKSRQHKRALLKQHGLEQRR